MRFTCLIRGTLPSNRRSAATDQEHGLLSVILERVHDAVHPVCGAGESNPDALIRLEQLRRAMGPSHLGMVDGFLPVGAVASGGEQHA